MWWVWMGAAVLHKPSTAEFRVRKGKLSVGLDMAGSLRFDIPTSHPSYAVVAAAVMGGPAVRVERDGEEVFRGRVVKVVRTPLAGSASVVCEGELAELNDTLVPPYEFAGSPRELLAMLLEQHNRHCRERFEAGAVTVSDPNDYVVRSSSDTIRTWDELLAKTSGSSLGGHLSLRREGGTRYVDWLSEGDGTCGQDIRLGRNLLSQTEEADGSELATAVLAEGAVPEGAESPVTLAGLPDGPLGEGVSLVDGYAVNEALLARHGWIARRERWEDVALVGNLLDRARAAAAALREPESVEVTAVDLRAAGYDVGALSPGRTVRLAGRDIDATMLVERAEHDFDDPGRDRYSFGPAVRTQSASSVAVNDAAMQAETARCRSEAAVAAAREARDAAVVLRVDSSRGTAFKNSEVGTVLTARVFAAGGPIGDAAALRERYGPSARLEWEWQRGAGGAYGTVPAADPRLSDEGFSLAVGPADVDGKVVFRCSLVV